MKKISQLSKLEQKQLSALEKRLAGGKTLTSAQMAFVQACQAKTADIPATSEPDIAAGGAELARRLGVSRQVVSWHQGRADAPKSYSVAAWREYLRLHGRMATQDRVESAGTEHDTIEQTLEAYTLGQWESLSDALPDIISAALKSEGVSLSRAKVDRLIFQIWLRLAAEQQAVAKRQGIPGGFDGHDSGAVIYPEKITELAERVALQSEPKAGQ